MFSHESVYYSPHKPAHRGSCGCFSKQLIDDNFWGICFSDWRLWCICPLAELCNSGKNQVVLFCEGHITQHCMESFVGFFFFVCVCFFCQFTPCGAAWILRILWWEMIVKSTKADAPDTQLAKFIAYLISRTIFSCANIIGKCISNDQSAL